MEMLNRDAIGEVMRMTAMELARYVICYANMNNKPISHLKLQKILYFVFGAFLKRFNTFLFQEKFEAWPYGPVIREVYIQYCANGAMPLYEDENSISLCDQICEEGRELINHEIEVCLSKTARKLVQATHDEGPWTLHKNEVEHGMKPVITDDEMRSYFLGEKR